MTDDSPQPFPTDSADIFWSFIAAPFWSDVNLLENSSVYWEIRGTDDSNIALSEVSDLIRSQYTELQFTATWMLVATWQDVVSPSLTTVGYKHLELCSAMPYLKMQGNTFQAILVTDGAKSFAIFTYRCELLEWSSPATIGINAPTDGYYNHPLTGTVIPPDEIACVHVNSEWNNVVIDTEPNPIVLAVTPEPSSFIG